MSLGLGKGTRDSEGILVIRGCGWRVYNHFDTLKSEAYCGQWWVQDLEVAGGGVKPTMEVVF